MKPPPRVKWSVSLARAVGLIGRRPAARAEDHVVPGQRVGGGVVQARRRVRIGDEPEVSERPDVLVDSRRRAPGRRQLSDDDGDAWNAVDCLPRRQRAADRLEPQPGVLADIVEPAGRARREDEAPGCGGAARRGRERLGCELSRKPACDQAVRRADSQSASRPRARSRPLGPCRPSRCRRRAGSAGESVPCRHGSGLRRAP